MKDLLARYESVLEKINHAADSVGRNPSDIQLVVVTKGQPAQVIETLYQAGARKFGENRIEEAKTKKIELSAFPQIEWQMIGHVQSRKAFDVVDNFSLLHSLDRIKLARRINRFAQESGKRFPVLLQFNVSGEEVKSGWIADDENDWPQLLEEVGQILQMENLDVQGLMTMPPYSPNPENSRPYYQRLHQLREFFISHFSQEYFADLSMGMSSDYEVAVQEGATLLRVGSAIVSS